MSGTTANWPEAKLGDILSLEYGKGLPERERKAGLFPVYGSNGQVGTHITPLINEPVIIVGRKGSVGSVQFSPKPCWPIDTTYWVKPKTNINIDWLHELLTFINLNRLNEASGVPGLNRENAYRLKIALPPLAEQERIVEILSDADAAIATAETSLQCKNNELKALQQKLFTPIYSGRNHRLDEFLSLRNERILPNDDIPLFSLTIEDGVCPKSERYDREHLVSDTSAKKYKVVYPDDIVFNPQNVRWGAIARSYQSAPVCLSPIYEVMHVIEEKADPDFFDHFLTCDRQVAYYAANTEGSLIERMAFKADAMMSLKFNIPSIEEQRNIAQVLECYRAHIGHQNSLVTALKKQKRGLMQQLLTGKLRVPEKV